MSEWKPGDVAMAEYGNGLRDVALRLDPRGWEVPGGHLKDGDHTGTTFRPLVVIDPEDADQVFRLAAAVNHLGGFGLTDTIVGLYAAALREFAAPTPPAEPQGLGAVVEDAEGRRFVKWSTLHRNDRNWKCHDKHGGDYREWKRLVHPVRVLSEGVS